jgi:hypothetical protein
MDKCPLTGDFQLNSDEGKDFANYLALLILSRGLLHSKDLGTHLPALGASCAAEAQTSESDSSFVKNMARSGPMLCFEFKGTMRLTV